MPAAFPLHSPSMCVRWSLHAANSIPHLWQHSKTYLKGDSQYSHCLNLRFLSPLCTATEIPITVSLVLTMAILFAALLACRVPWSLLGSQHECTPPALIFSLIDQTYCLQLLHHISRRQPVPWETALGVANFEYPATKLTCRHWVKTRYSLAVLQTTKSTVNPQWIIYLILHIMAP